MIYQDIMYQQFKYEFSNIINEKENYKEYNTMKTILENIAAGLKSFTGGTFIAALGGVATRVLNFLRGEESPIAEIMKLAEKSEELKTGAEAIG